MTERRFTTDEMTALLVAADRYLTSPQVIVIIGGCAAAFAGANSTTTDIDTFESILT